MVSGEVTSQFIVLTRQVITFLLFACRMSKNETIESCRMQLFDLFFVLLMMAFRWNRFIPLLCVKYCFISIFLITSSGWFNLKRISIYVSLNTYNQNLIASACTENFTSYIYVMGSGYVARRIPSSQRIVNISQTQRHDKIKNKYRK